ncbi:MAG: SAM-dependent methyltransferase [Bacteroidales bacterium]|nr:SAM-dependent methyltransferase [Bacteroidales bacterium]
MPGKLYLIPKTIGNTATNKVLPHYNHEIINALNEFIVEDARTARRFLKASGYEGSLDNLMLHVLNKHTLQEEIPGFLENCLAGKDIGLMSEAGLPCIADPGNVVVSLAHQKGIQVIPLVGPSSILLALMASGFNGQQFAFHGYLPIPLKDKEKKIREMERSIYRLDQTQIFMEAPYRNNKLLDNLLNTCQPDTVLCIAASLTTEEEYIKTLPIKNWAKKKPDLHKKPALFLLYK